MKKTYAIEHHNILAAIGNTPMVKLCKIPSAKSADVFVKLEYLNPTGSYKDRMALAIIEESERKGVLKKGMTVIECTAGGTGTSLALVCSAKGYTFKVISSDAFAAEKLKAMSLFGAELELFKSDNGKITPDLIPRMIARAEELSAEKGNFWTQQFKNTDALAGYRKMGEEIISAVRHVDAFVASVGTAGMFMGVSAILRQSNPGIRGIILEPESAPLISKGIKGTHKVDGIGVGFVPPMLSSESYDTVLAIAEEEGRRMAKRLAAEEGIFGGTSTGLNVVGALQIAEQLGPGKTVVTVACDHGMKYINAGLFD
jgi:cysteine synthase A